MKFFLRWLVYGLMYLLVAVVVYVVYDTDAEKALQAELEQCYSECSDQLKVRSEQHCVKSSYTYAPERRDEFIAGCRYLMREDAEYCKLGCIGQDRNKRK